MILVGIILSSLAGTNDLSPSYVPWPVQLHRLVAELERLLDDGALDDAVGHAAQRHGVLVEADDLDLARLPPAPPPRRSAAYCRTTGRPARRCSGTWSACPRRCGLALAKSTSSRGRRGSRPWCPEAFLMPWTRSRALAAPGMPTNIMILPPSGSAFLISPPHCSPAATLSVPIRAPACSGGVAVGGEQHRLRSHLVQDLGLERGSLTLTDTPATPLVSRSSSTRRCSAAVASASTCSSTL